MAAASNVYPNAQNEPVGPLLKTLSNFSVQVERTSGAGAVGTYQARVSNSNKTYVDAGSVISDVGITELALFAQYVKVDQLTPPAGGTEVLVTLYTNSPNEL